GEVAGQGGRRGRGNRPRCGQYVDRKRGGLPERGGGCGSRGVVKGPAAPRAAGGPSATAPARERGTATLASAPQPEPTQVTVAPNGSAESQSADPAGQEKK